MKSADISRKNWRIIYFFWEHSIITLPQNNQNLQFPFQSHLFSFINSLPSFKSFKTLNQPPLLSPIERVNLMKFLSVLLDHNLSWKEHIKYLENKIAKNIGLMYRGKAFLDKESLLALYYSYIHSY